VTSARDLGHFGWSDQARLDYATGEGRLILTEDRQDFAPLARR